MPSSRPNTIPTVIHLLRQLKPQSILDVGVGFGKWGHLFREYTDILEAEQDPARYQRANWRVRIDGIEGHAAYLTEMHRFLYDEIHVGNASVLMKSLPNYDLIFLGDIIEHFEKEAGLELLCDGRARANKAVIVSTPKFETEQEALCGNELERHRSLWSTEDFRQFPGAIVTTVDDATLLAVLPQPGGPKLDCSPPQAPQPGAAARLRLAREEATACIPLDAPFVLVDEEQLRPSLPHRHARPFLERDGVYWGPPADGATAVRELDRMRTAGARFIAFLWSSLWWLDHYPELANCLKRTARRINGSEQIAIYDLSQRESS